MTTTFDFQDGNGAVPAHQHANGGGWVANTATVADTAFVGPNARVYGNAWVIGNTRVAGNACVYGNAVISENACVGDNAEVSGNACVYNENVTERTLDGDYNSPTKNNEQSAKNVDANIEIKLYTDFIVVNGVKYIKEPT